VKENKFKLNFQEPSIALKFAIVGGVLLLMNTTFLENIIIFKYSLYRLDIMLITYIISLVIYSFRIQAINSKLILFTFYYILYFFFISSIIAIVLNSSIYLFKSKNINYFETELVYKFEGTLKTSKQVCFYMNDIRCNKTIPKHKNINNASKIKLKYFESILGAKVIDDYELY